jgi:pyruvate/2-oxoglutarate dehydrogenase complex dihydrolipoamide dehydrogenase (E3) component
VLVSSRDRVLPGEDAQAATVLEDVLTRRGMTVLSRRRANGATREAMQGGIAMWHALGDAVKPPNLNSVSANVFTAPEIATVGWSQDAVTAVTPTRAEAARRLHTRPEHGR